MDSISVVIAAHNEEARIARLLPELSWENEIVLVDGTSSDRTAAIAAESGARVFVRPNQVVPEINKNIGIEQASGDWVLVLDADEHVPPALVQALRAITVHPGDVVALRLARQNVIFGEWMRHGLRWPDYQTRFFKRGAARIVEAIHGRPVVQGAMRDLPARPELALVHDPVESISDWVHKLTRYAVLDAQTQRRKGVHPSLWRIIAYPPGLFLYDYIWRRAFLDGRRGLILAGLMAYYTFLKRVILWELSTQKPSSPSSS